MSQDSSDLDRRRCPCMDLLRLAGRAECRRNRALMAEYAASPVTVRRRCSSSSGSGWWSRVRAQARSSARSAPPAQPTTLADRSARHGARRTRGLSSTQRTVSPDAIGLHSGYPAVELLPERLVRQALVRGRTHRRRADPVARRGAARAAGLVRGRAGRHRPPRRRHTPHRRAMLSSSRAVRAG